MPPVDTGAPTPAPENQAPTPDQTPAPEQPKQLGFWARLFGGGKKEAPVAPTIPADHESQTPPPQLDIETDRSTVPEVSEPVAFGNESTPSTPAPNDLSGASNVPTPQVGDVPVAGPTIVGGSTDPAVSDDTQPTNPSQPV